jgi:hypothetical protein
VSRKKWGVDSAPPETPLKEEGARRHKKKAGSSGVHGRTNPACVKVLTTLPPVKNIRLKETGLQKKIRGVFSRMN